jgi:serine/threonine-protein kinase
MDPDGWGLWDIKVKLAISERGDLSVGARALEKVKSIPAKDQEKLKLAGARVDFLLLQRKYKEVLEMVEALPDDLVDQAPEGHAMKYFAIGVAQKGLRNEAAARVALLKAKNTCEEELKEKPDDAGLHIAHAKVLALLGEKDAALAEAQRAMELHPESKDAFEGPQITEQVAQVHATLGDNDQAIEILDGLLNRPSEVTVNTLKLNPAWDPLRTDPRFQALLTKYAGKT